MEPYRTSLCHDKPGGFFARTGDKAPPPIHHARVIRASLTLVPNPLADLGKGVPAPLRRSARTSRTSAKAPETQVFPSLAPAPVPAWARAHGRAGESEPLFCAGAGLALLDAHLHRDPPAAGALRSRLALHSAAASTRIRRLNADAAALRDLRFAMTAEPPPAAKLLQLWQDLAARPPGLDARRLAAAAGLLDCSVAAPDALAESLSETARAGDPISAAAKAAAAVFAAVPDAPAADAEILAHWVFDAVLALRLRWPRPLPLIATKLLDPGLRSDGGGRRPRPGEPGWEKAAAGAIALAAAAALDLAAGLARRADMLIAVAPKLRAKPAQRIVDLLLNQDCVAPAEAARHAPMTDRAARRLFDRLVTLGAAREFSGRPAFRLYGL
jgi:Protein of unknown function (DUF1403)